MTRSLLSFGLFLACRLHAAPAITLVLGQPTDRSITIGARADAALEWYFEYGARSGDYTGQTKPAAGTADPNAAGFWLAQTVIAGLQADTQYFYRIDYRLAGSSAAFTPGAENSFHTQRPPGSTFVFCVQGDSHPERAKTMFDANLYIQTLKAAASAKPDFYITNGDDFSVDTLATPYTAPAVAGRYTLQLPYFDLIARSAPLFLGTGNHEETSLSNYNLPPDSDNSNIVPVWAQNARNLYYPMPSPGDPNTAGFYSGNATTLPKIGLLRDYYAWQWGDALFVVIDPYWSSPAQVDTGLGGQNGGTSKTGNKWDITHGDAQYRWLQQTLEQSQAKWKFVFAHHVLGTGRGGIEVAGQYEWGGDNANGSSGFAANRPSWPLPLHQLMVANHVTVFFQAHDHLFAHQQLDGVTYQSLPNPADNTYTAFNADAYTSGEVYPNAGFTKVTVGPSSVRVEYIREWLPQDEKPPSEVSGTVQFSYTIPPGGATAPVVASANTAGGGAGIAPNTWVEIKGSNLAPAGDTRIWQGSDFVGNRMPAQLDGVGVTVNGKPAYVYYISPSQINILTPPDAMSGAVPIQVTVGGAASSVFSAPASSTSPAFFTYTGTPYAAATHADGSYVLPSTPARPGETVALYGNGFGATSTPVVAASPAQSGTLVPPPEVRIGGAPVAVQFAGLVSPGLFQFNVVIPAGAAGDQPVTSASASAVIPIQR